LTAVFAECPQFACFGEVFDELMGARKKGVGSLFSLGEKGSGVFSHAALGRPRGRSVDSIPNRLASRRTQASSPKGRPRFTLSRSASSSDARSGRFTRATQARGCSTGQSLSQVVSLASPSSRRQTLDHCQSSTRVTSFARSALRSTSRATVRKCSSVCTGNDLKRP